MSWGIREQWLTSPNEAVFCSLPLTWYPSFPRSRSIGICWVADSLTTEPCLLVHVLSQRASFPVSSASTALVFWISYKIPDMPPSQPWGRGSLPGPKASKRCLGQHRSSPTRPKSGSLSTRGSLEYYSSSLPSLPLSCLMSSSCSFPISEPGSPLSTVRIWSDIPKGSPQALALFRVQLFLSQDT